MTTNNYSIIFSSVTGNTEKLADTIHETLPQDMCDYFGGNELQVPESDLLYIGFWTDKGNADNQTLELLSKLKNKKIFLFGTAGFGGSDTSFIASTPINPGFDIAFENRYPCSDSGAVHL